MAFSYDWESNTFSIKEDGATPESLRQAAKVLEDKAKELEKPKYTERQKDFLAGKYSHITDRYIRTSDCGKRGWPCSVRSMCEEAKELANKRGWRIVPSKRANLDGIPMYPLFGSLYINFDRL